MALSGMAVLPGFLYFCSTPASRMFSLSITAVNLLVGLGWLPTSRLPVFPEILWYIFFMSLQIIGYRSLLRSRDSALTAWSISSWVQIGLILCLNFIANYSFIGRQILFLTPFFCFVAALGIETIITSIQMDRLHVSSSRLRRYRILLVSSFAVLGILLSFSCLQSFYHEEKSPRKAISNIIIEEWELNEEIWFSPSWELHFYKYYVGLLGHPEIQYAFKGIENIHTIPLERLPICWIFSQANYSDVVSIVEENDFQSMLFETKQIPDAQFIWCR